jgi:RNA exonuclease 1
MWGTLKLLSSNFPSSKLTTTSTHEKRAPAQRAHRRNMWPSAFQLQDLNEVACPEGTDCELPNCFYSHIASPALSPIVDTTTAGQDDAEPPVEETDKTAKPQIFVGSLVSTFPASNGGDSTVATKLITPPPPKTEAVVVPPESDIEVNLMPRKLQQEPVPWATRLQMLKALLHWTIAMNNTIKRAVQPEIQALVMSDGQLNKIVMDEEEKVAKEHGAVYSNVMRQHVSARSKMTIQEWVKSRKVAMLKADGESPKKLVPKKIVTGLTPMAEVSLLYELKATQVELDRHGVLTKVPTEKDIENAKITLEWSGFWEICDRCGTRFQIFPDRREEDGALTTGGPCLHHWGKKQWPDKLKHQPRGLPMMTCCGEAQGETQGCTYSHTHVIKIADVKRLALMMPFIETPENDKAKSFTAICFDCEMGYTTHGLELLRLTSVAWPSYKPLVDVLVKPLGSILDLNTRFSGVTTEQFLEAKPYDPDHPAPKRTDLRMVDSPYEARELFLAHISPQTPLIGHSIENDLNALRLIHPTIVDTVMVYPAPGGLPYRQRLRTLAKTHLGIAIQQGGEAGHDSYEDAKTTGELVRNKIAEMWKIKSANGWTKFDDGIPYPPPPWSKSITSAPPLPPGPPPPCPPPPPSAPPAPPMIGSQVPAGEESKRKREENEDTDEEPPTKKLEV